MPPVAANCDGHRNIEIKMGGVVSCVITPKDATALIEDLARAIQTSMDLEDASRLVPPQENGFVNGFVPTKYSGHETTCPESKQRG